MSKFGVREMRKALAQREIALPSNVLAYGFSSPNERSPRRNLTLQREEEKRLRNKLSRLAGLGVPIVWLLHLDDRTRPSASALHETDTPNAVRVFSVASNGAPALNVTDHPAGVRLDLDELTQSEIDRLAEWRPDEMARQREQLEFVSPPTSAADERKRTLSSIVVRQGQPAFRASLIRAYGSRCAVTGNDCEDVLEAAHIRPYAGPNSNSTTNGLLLRADIHVLFDLFLMAIEPRDLTVMIASRLRASQYGGLHGHRLVSIPASRDQPDRRALAEHQRRARLANRFE